MPMRIYPAPHYTMGGLWVDYHLESTDSRALRARRGQLLRPRREPPRRERPDAGARRRLLRDPVHDRQPPRADAARRGPVEPPGVRRLARRGRGDGRSGSSRINGRRTITDFHRALGTDHVGERRHGAQRGGAAARRSRAIPALRAEFWDDVRVVGRRRTLNRELERAGRVADFLEFAELHGARRARARRVLRRPLPRRSTRCRTARPGATTSASATSRPGSTAGDGAGASRRLHVEPARVRREIPPRRAELQVTGARGRPGDAADAR